MNFFKESLAQRGDILKSFTTLIGEGAENHLIFTKEKSSSLAAAVRKINNGLSDGKKKPKSLKSSIVQLISLLQQCPQSLLNAEGEKWVRLCFQNLSNPDKSVEKCLLVIISFILKSSHDNKELCKKLSKLSFMLAQRFSRCHILLRSHNYRCLYENLRLFPNEALSQRSFIEHKLMRVMSSPLDAHRDLVYSAASVYAALPVPGGVGNAPEMKGGQLEQLISLSHCAADAIFYDIKEDRKYNFNRDHKLPIKTIDSACELKDPVIRILTASVVLGNCFDFIKIFFEKCVSNFILIKPIDLINLSFRILQVELQSLKRKESIEVKTLSFVLPSLHLRTLSLLKCLIQNNVCTFQMNLVEEQIISTLKSMGRASSNVRLVKGEGESNPNAETMLQSFLTVRVQCYETLSQIAKVYLWYLWKLYGRILVTNLVAYTI
ncbi:hypothetical protein Anas_03593 [Armadillidium nasatum]|uniref:Uncharacterized protein n=1 Tax=Armadillidium nasatum TaxID=96803 RepID=A0A5N5ST90_9CRUS|nr:hypothetical protein Anas_03593 [Armadillidium nasatum]